ncbi:MAG: hypothetical protein PEPC_01781 [Peptostreptococcus russellii]
METAKFEELKSYYNDLKQNSNKGDLFYNTDRVHNSLVMSNILDESKEVKMYCGEFSLFRKEFKKKVDDVFTLEQLHEFSPIEILYQSLKKYLLEGKNIYVIIEDNADTLSNEPVFQNIIKPYISKNIFFYLIDSNYKATYHFTVGDKDKYRRETGLESHSAICSMKDSLSAKIMLNQYDILLNNSTLLYNN